MSQLRSVVIGATGLIGRALVDCLVAHPAYDAPTTLTRRSLEVEGTRNHVIDFDHLDAADAVIGGDVVFSCLGTTRRRAGSLAAQKIVDVDYQFAVAQRARQKGVPHFCLVSSSGAHPTSRSPYLQMKGELEERVRALQFERLTIFQPSLLLGARDHHRPGEEMAARILPWITRLPFLRAYRPIAGALVAQKMAADAAQSRQGESVYRLDEIFELA